MANMSYCRFENTASDLDDCIDAMRFADDMVELDLSESEQDEFTRMAKLCRQYLKEFDRLIQEC